jgi:hypothetical protein
MLNVELHVVAPLPWPRYVAVKLVVVTAWVTSTGSSGGWPGSGASVQAPVARASESKQGSAVFMSGSPVARALPAGTTVQRAMRAVHEPTAS